MSQFPTQHQIINFSSSIWIFLIYRRQLSLCTWCLMLLNTRLSRNSGVFTLTSTASNDASCYHVTAVPEGTRVKKHYLHIGRYFTIICLCLFVLCFILLSQTGSHVSQAVLKVGSVLRDSLQPLVILPSPLRCWDYTCMIYGPASCCSAHAGPAFLT